MIYIKLGCSTRLGNWMFQYAAAKLFSNGDEVAFFNPDEKVLARVQKFGVLFENARYVTEVDAGVEIRDGLFQDSKYIDRQKSRLLYKCPDDILNTIESKYSELLKDKSLVSVHVRRGDYMQLPHRHPFVGKKYLSDAIALFPNSRFLVCSDDIHWCKQFFKGERFIFSEKNSVLVDLFLMSMCKGGHICSNSTFSWWGAFLGEGRTIFPSMWYGFALKNEDWKGLYFEGSEVIENSYSWGMRFHAYCCMIKLYCGNIVRKLLNK